MIPVYLAQLGVLHPLNDTTVKALKNSSFAIMAFALLLGAFIILRAMWQGRRAERLTAEQEAFLNRFHSALGGALEAGVAEAQKKVSEGFTPLLAQWKSMTDAHQQEMRATYQQMGEQAAEQHTHRLEAVSNQWMLASVASLDHQSREMISGIASTAEEKLREACAQVFAGVGESLRERLAEIAKSFTISPEAPPRAKSAKISG